MLLTEQSKFESHKLLLTKETVFSHFILKLINKSNDWFNQMKGN